MISYVREEGRTTTDASRERWRLLHRARRIQRQMAGVPDYHGAFLWQDGAVVRLLVAYDDSTPLGASVWAAVTQKHPRYYDRRAWWAEGKDKAADGRSE